MKKNECPGIKAELLGPDGTGVDGELELRVGEAMVDGNTSQRARIVAPYELPEPYRSGRQYEAYPDGIVSPDGWGCGI